MFSISIVNLSYQPRGCIVWLCTKSTSEVKYMKNLITTLNQGDFHRYLDSVDKPVLVDFWAEWCGPCRAVTPVLEKLAGELENRVHVTKVDVDNNPELVKEYAIRGIPTLLLFNNGQLVAQRTGAGSYGELKSFIGENS